MQYLNVDEFNSKEKELIKDVFGKSNLTKPQFYKTAIISYALNEKKKELEELLGASK